MWSSAAWKSFRCRDGVTFVSLCLASSCVMLVNTYDTLGSPIIVLVPKNRFASRPRALCDSDQFLPAPGTVCRAATPGKSLHVEGSQLYLLPAESRISVEDFFDGCALIHHRRHQFNR